MATCTCGDDEDEHGHDPNYPGSSACAVDDCDCIAYEKDRNAEEDDEE